MTDPVPPRRGLSRLFRSAGGLAALLCATLVLASGAAHPARAAVSNEARTNESRTGEIGTGEIGTGDIADRAGLESFIDGAVEALMTAHDIPGATLSLVHKGEVALLKGYGWADAARSRPVDAERTVFRAASISKLFTATAVMQLVEDGTLDLDTDVNTYLTGIQIPMAFGTPITLRHLLTHTAGFEDRVLNLFAADADDLRPLAEALAASMPKRVRPPGQVAAYSNWGAALAGLIVAIQAGTDFDTLMAERIFEPLGMTQSTFTEPVPEQLAPDLAEGVARDRGLLVPMDFEYLGNLAPAGALSTTAADMANFMLAHLNGGAFRGRRILRTETLQRMHSRLFAHDPRLPGLAHGFMEQTVNGVPLLVHGGDTLYFHGQFLLIPEEDIGLFVAFNAPLGALARDQLTTAFMDYYFPAPDQAAIEPPEDFAGRAMSYAGAYRNTRRPYSRADKALALLGDLSVMPTTDQRLLVTGFPGVLPVRQFVEIEPDLFQQVDGASRIAFGRDRGGRVNHLFVGELPFMAFERLAWWQTGALHQTVLGFGFMAAFATVVASLWSVATWWAMGWREKLSRGAVFAAAVSYSAFLIGLIVVLSTEGIDLLSSTPASLGTVLTLPLFAAAFSVLAAMGLYPAWRQGFWASPFARARHTGVVALFLAMALSLTYWNLMGWWMI